MGENWRIAGEKEETWNNLDSETYVRKEAKNDKKGHAAIFTRHQKCFASRADCGPGATDVPSHAATQCWVSGPYLLMHY